MTLVNISGKSVNKEIPLREFLPNYFEEVKIEKSLEEQRKEWDAFKLKLKRLQEGK